MKPFNKTVFRIATVIFGLLLIPSFLAAFGEDEGTLPESSFWMLFARLFEILRFPTHTLLWTLFSNNGALVFFGGLILNCCFYGVLTERLISIFKPNKKILTLSILLFSLTLNSCKKRETNEIKIAETLYVHQDYETNKELRNLIQEALDQNEKSLPKLTNFPCGGGAGCYDLGFILTQIIYQIGEKEFNQMVLRLDRNETKGIRSLIIAGLEYGDHDNDGKMDNRRIENEFPILNETLKK